MSQRSISTYGGEGLFVSPEQRKAYAGAEAVGVLAAMLRLGVCPAELAANAQRAVKEYLEAEQACMEIHESKRIGGK
jgi:hypothetical protein